MDAAEFRKAAHAAIEQIIEYNTNIASYDVLPNVKPGFLAKQIPDSAPQQPQSWEEIQPDIQDKIVPGITHWQHPMFTAYFPACVTYPSILGEMYSATFNAPAFQWICSPSCTELETIVMDWMCKALDLPPCFLSNSQGGGVIQGSASEAVVTCMVAARERFVRRRCDAEGITDREARIERMSDMRGRLIALASDQAHSATHKGANINGTRYGDIKASFSNDLALQSTDVAAALEDCTSRGLEPYFLTLTLGTTATAACDDFAAIATLKEKYPEVWIHVDAAYAGTALICPEYSQQYSKLMEIADSFNTNMHKWLLVNFDASLLWVQNRNDLKAALSIEQSIYENEVSESGLVNDYREWQIPLGRRFRALKIWFVVRNYGIQGLQDHIRRTIKVGEFFTDLVRKRNDLFEIVATPRFALTCFRVRPEAVPSALIVNGTSRDEMANRLTQKVHDLVNATHKIYVTKSVAEDKLFIRIVNGNENASNEAMTKAFEMLVDAVEKVMSVQ